MKLQQLAYAAIAFSLLLLSGCRTLNQTQFQIPNESGDEGRERIVALVQDAALNAGMTDLTAKSRTPNTLAYFEEPVSSYRTTLAARQVGDYVVIDLACFHWARCETPTFTVTRSLLEGALRRELGDQWRLVTDAAEQK